MANQQSAGVNDYNFTKPRVSDTHLQRAGFKRGGSGGDWFRYKFNKTSHFDSFGRAPQPLIRSPPFRGSAIGNSGHPPRHLFASSQLPPHQRGIGPGPPGNQSLPPPLPPHQRGIGPGPPGNQSLAPPLQSHQRGIGPGPPGNQSLPPPLQPPLAPPPPTNFQFRMPIPPRSLNQITSPTTASSSYPPSSSFPPLFGFPQRPFFNPPYYNNRHSHKNIQDSHHNSGKTFHPSKRGNNHSQGASRGKCKKYYRPHNKPRFCRKKGRGVASLAGGLGKRGKPKAPSNSALTTSFLMSDYYRQEAVGSPDLRGNAGTHPIPDPESIPICCCEDDKRDCDACVNIHYDEHDQDEQDLDVTDEYCDCEDCCAEENATYDFMKCDFEQVFSELSADEMQKEPEEMDGQEQNPESS